MVHMTHVGALFTGAAVALALAGIGCASKDSGPITQQPIAGMTGGAAGAAGVTGGTAGSAAGVTGGAAGIAGGAAGVTGGAAGGAGGAAGIAGSAAGTTGGSTAGMTGGAAGMTGGSAGCGGSAGTAGSSGVGGPSDAIPCEVDTLLMQACHRCHDTALMFGAPVALATLADFQRDYVAATTKELKGRTFKLYELARIRINREMGTSPMPQGPPLTDEEKAILNTWLITGAPGGTGCATP
jgi:hypothetical protein